MSNDSEFYAEGGNHRITIGAEGIAYVRVWRRPDVSREVGASYARDMVNVFAKLANEPWTRVRGVVMDLTEAAMTWGPVTEAAVCEMFSSMEKAGRWIAVVTPPDAVSLMTAQNALKRSAPRCGRAFSSISSAKTWAGQRKRISVW